RDFHVTGVQTCALPISGAVAGAAALFLALVLTGETSGGGGPLELFGVLTRDELELMPVWLLALIGAGALVAPIPRRLAARGMARSEERRVGKECRSRVW